MNGEIDILTQEEIDILFSSMEAGKSSKIDLDSDLRDFYICKYCRSIYNIKFSFTEYKSKKLFNDKNYLFPSRIFLNNGCNCNLILFSDLIKNTINLSTIHLNCEQIQKLNRFLENLKQVKIEYGDKRLIITKYKSYLDNHKARLESNQYRKEQDEIYRQFNRSGIK